MPRSIGFSLARQYFLSLLVICFALAGFMAVLPGSADAGWGSLMRKAARKADDGAGSIGHKLDIDGLKHLDVEPGVSRFGLSTHADGSVSIKSMDGKELRIGASDDLDAALANFTRSVAKAGVPVEKPRFFVTVDDLFMAGKSQLVLAKINGLHVVTGAKTSLPVSRVRGADGAQQWGVKIRKGIIAAIPDRRSFSEATFRMNHAFNPADIHIVSFSGKAPDIPDVLNLAQPGHVPKPTLINPKNLDDSFLALRGKKLVVSGKIEDGVLLVKSGTGGAQRLPLEDLRRRAKEVNIDLIVLGRQSAAQPGKKFQIGKKADRSFAAAFKTERYGDFLAALGGKNSPMVMHMSENGATHVVWRSAPEAGKPSKGLLERVEGETLGEVIAGGVLKAGVKKAAEKADEQNPQVSVELNAKSKDWQKELERRIIPGIPFMTQVFYAISVFAGLASWGVSTWLWDKIWPPKGREDFKSKPAFYTIRFLRYFLMIFVMMGAIGILLLIVHSSISAWKTFMNVLRFITWPVRKLLGVFR